MCHPDPPSQIFGRCVRGAVGLPWEEGAGGGPAASSTVAPAVAVCWVGVLGTVMRWMSERGTRYILGGYICCSPESDGFSDRLHFCFW
jgi:hypothetical protein